VGSTNNNTPHDALFKAGFETPEHAAALFRQVLPKPIVDAIDWSTLRREAGSFIDPTLAASHSDLLFSAQLVLAPGQEVLLYLLAEHQSRTPRDMCLRVLGYMVRAWERYRKDHRGRPLPPIIPIVISHDPNGWTEPTSFHDLFEPGLLATIPEFAKFLPSFELRVEDLIDIDDRQLRRWQLTTFALLTLQLLRDARTPARIQACLPEWMKSLRQLRATPNGRMDVEQVYRYILQVARELPIAEFRATVRRQLPETEDIAMTIAEQLRAEGLAEGEAKGRAEGEAKARTHALKKMMTLKFGSLSAEHATRIEATTEQQLDMYIERILTASTIEEVFATEV
jgi:predicted transposase/invertase (TIGR01784 family)